MPLVRTTSFDDQPAILDTREYPARQQRYDVLLAGEFRPLQNHGGHGFLIGNFENAEQLIVELLRRGASKVDQAAVYRLKVQFHVMKSEHHQAVHRSCTVGGKSAGRD
jgi:hypothetical protein